MFTPSTPAWTSANSVSSAQRAMANVLGTPGGVPHEIVFISSISVRQPLPFLALSNSLRAAVSGVAKTLSLELAADQITVNSVAPDAILTDRIRQLAGGDEEGVRAMGERTPMGRLGTPEEFAAAVVFLCSRQAAYISGQTLGVDGGSLRGVH